MKFTLKLDAVTQVVSLDSDSREVIDWLGRHDVDRLAMVHRVANDVLARLPKLECSERALRALAAEIAAGLREVSPGETFEIEPEPMMPPCVCCNAPTMWARGDVSMCPWCKLSLDAPEPCWLRMLRWWVR